MISEDTARKMGIKFFREQGCPEVASRLSRDDACLEDIFSYAVKSLGKFRVLALYNMLPKQLKIYVLIMLGGDNNLHLADSLYGVYTEFEGVIESGKPEQCKKFPECIEKADKILVKYLTRR